MVNEQVVKQRFLSALLSHYEIILREPWLRENSAVKDYAHNVLWQWSNGVLKPIAFSAQVRTDPLAVAPDRQARAPQYAHESRQAMLAAAVNTGLCHATMSLFERQAEITYDLEDQSRYKNIPCLGVSAVWSNTCHHIRQRTPVARRLVTFKTASIVGQGCTCWVMLPKK